MKISFIVFVFSYLFTSHRATRRKIENWPLTGSRLKIPWFNSVEGSMGTLSLLDSTQLVTLRKYSELQHQLS